MKRKMIMKRKKIIVGALSIALLFGAFQIPSLFATESLTKVYAAGNDGGTAVVGSGDVSYDFSNESALEAENVDPDVNHDGYVNSDDAKASREILLEKQKNPSSDVNCDVNCDETSDLKDLVALTIFLQDITQRDNDLGVDKL